MIKAGLERFSQSLAMELQGDKIAANVLSPQGRINTPGNAFAQNDPNNPNLDFERAGRDGQGHGLDLRDHTPSFTGNILFDDDFCQEKGL